MTLPHADQPMVFRGCYTAIVTPFTHDGLSIDEDRLAEQLRHQANGGVMGVVVAGTTGESPTLTEREWRTLVRKVVELGKPLGLQVIAGTGSNSTAHAVHLQKIAEEVGADASLSVNPYYNKPGQEGLYRHFMMQADSASIPTVLYNIPGRTGVALAPETVGRLALHPNIRAIKEATGLTDSATEILMRAPKLALLSGDDSMTLPFASVGGVGVVSVASNVVPARVSAMCSAFLSGRWNDALGIHRELFTLCRALFAETNPIPVKAALKIMELDTGVLRLPMTEAKPETVKLLRSMLTKEPVTLH